MTAFPIISIAKLLATMLLLRTHIYAFKKSFKPFSKLQINSLNRVSCVAGGIVGKNENNLASCFVFFVNASL